ncbi:lysostaphin resistance A-like protein [Chitinophagaceae bacterium MMS25-I14]
MMVCIMYTFLLAMIMTFLPRYGLNLPDVISINAKSPHNLIETSLLVQFIMHMSMFMIPALLFSYVTHPRPAEYLGLRKPGKPVQWLLVILIILGAIPVMIAIEAFCEKIGIGGGTVRDWQQKSKDLTEAYLNMQSVGDFIKVFAVMAIVPALGEEMAFRGILMRMLHKICSKGVIVLGSGYAPGTVKSKMRCPIVISAIIFSLFHFSVYSFVSIFIAGLLLGIIYYLTRSLWCSILAHLINNGLQIFLIYAFGNSPVMKAMAESNNLPWYLPAGGALLCGGALYLLWKNRTPLTPDWSVDFSREELAEDIA